MLRELHIQNLAVIADARIELSAGLNCFTGATGAGKSLVIGAVSVLLGLRGAGEMLRRGADEGRVSGVFELADADLKSQIEQICDFKFEGDASDLLLTRRLFASGRTSVSLNGSPITLAMLKQVGDLLVDVHGQHDHQYLLKPSNQLDVIDQFAGAVGVRKLYQENYQKLEAARSRLEELGKGKTLREQQLEFYKFQAGEIDTAELDAAEFEALGARSQVLENAESIKAETGEAYASVYDAEGSIVDQLKSVVATLEDNARLDATLTPVADAVREAMLALENAGYDLGRYVDKLEIDPEEMGEVTARLNAINKVLNKYGGTVDAAMEYRAAIGSQIDELERATTDLSGLKKSLEPLAAAVKQHGAELSKRRKGAAAKLGPMIEGELAELGMGKAKFSIDVSTATDATASGCDAVEFIAQTNPGLAPQPLRKIASGGELSRIMLALKGVLAAGDRVSVLVFDEIDSNVGGRLGSIIGNKLRSLATHHQVLCITHLPQIASYGDRHLTVRKEVHEGLTSTKVRPMTGAERLEEIAEMIGGERITETTRAQARELLESAGGAAPATNGKSGRGRKSPRRTAAIEEVTA